MLESWITSRMCGVVKCSARLGEVTEVCKTCDFFSFLQSALELKARVILVGTARHSSRLYSSIFAPSDMLVDRKCTYPVSSIQFVLSFEIKHDLSWQIKNCDSEMAATAWRNALIRQGERRNAVLSSWWVVLRWMSRYLGPKRRLQSPQVQAHKKKKHGVCGLCLFSAQNFQQSSCNQMSESVGPIVRDHGQRHHFLISRSK